MEKLGVRTPAHPLVASLYIRRLFTNKTGDDYRHRMRSRRLTYEDLSRPSRWGSKLSNSNGTIWEIQLVPQRYLCRRWHIGSARADTTSLNSLSSKPWIPHSPQNHIGKTLTAKRPEWIFDQTEVKNIPMRCQSRTTWTLSFPIWWFKTQSYIIKMMPIFWLKKNTSIL